MRRVVVFEYGKRTARLLSALEDLRAESFRRLDMRQVVVFECRDANNALYCGFGGFARRTVQAPEYAPSSTI